MYSALTDAELISLLQENDTGAFRELYTRYSSKLLRYINGRTRDTKLTEDMVQNIFLSLWQNRRTFPDYAQANDYLYRAARNIVISHMRSKRVRDAYASEFSRRMEGRADNSNEETQMLSDLTQRIESKIELLPPQQQIAFRMSRYEHLPIQEIARRMNIAPRAVENYLTKALKHLRGSLGEVMVLVWWLM